MFQATGQKPKFVYAPTFLFDTIINVFQWVADTQLEYMEDAAEYARIGKILRSRRYVSNLVLLLCKIIIRMDENYVKDDTWLCSS